MASIPLLPEEPTPPTPENDPDGATFNYNLPNGSQNDVFLSPYKENFAIGRPPSLYSSDGPPASPYSPMVPFTPTLMSVPAEPMMQNGKTASPFNFQPMAMAKSPVTKSSVGQRRGHKYKHSSVSHQIFIEPAPRAPISLPNSLPVPTIRECWKSMSSDQKIRFYWSICHIAIAGFTLANAAGSLALTSLSHLLLYDSFGAIICGLVDVFSNFEVWKRSSIRHPFGLERAEVLAGFAMSVLLVFMGMDLISHNVTHSLEGLGSHEPHHSHAAHDGVPRHAINVSAFFAIMATIISARVLHNHARIGKVMRIGYFSNLPSILSNPSHFLTITCSLILLLLPHIDLHLYKYFDHALSVVIAFCMIVFGAQIVIKLGKMLLMTWSPSANAAGVDTASSSLTDLVTTVESDPLVSRVEEAKVWQVHYGLCMANFKLRVRGEEENLARLRDRLASLVRNKLGGGYGSGAGVRWEVTAQLEREKVGAAPKGRMSGGASRGSSGLNIVHTGSGYEKVDGKAL